MNFTDCNTFLNHSLSICCSCLNLSADIFAMYDDIDTQIIAASVRNPIHVIDCALAGADIATVPYNVLMQMVKHPLTDQGIEKFKKDYIAVFGE